jgi:hypothetical protein
MFSIPAENPPVGFSANLLEVYALLYTGLDFFAIIFAIFVQNRKITVWGLFQGERPLF